MDTKLGGLRQLIFKCGLGMNFEFLFMHMLDGETAGRELTDKLPFM
jgi:hypothetical protein